MAKKRSKQEYPLVEINWCDAATYGAGWQSIEVHRDNAKPINAKSAGYLIEANKNHVTIVQTITQDNDGRATDPLSIPRIWVKQIRYLK